MISTLAAAWTRMGTFAHDLIIRGITVDSVVKLGQDHDGRFSFEVFVTKGQVERSFDIGMTYVGTTWITMDGTDRLWNDALTVIEETCRGKS